MRLHPLQSPRLFAAYAVPRASSILVRWYVTWPDRTGMICDVSDPEAPTTTQPVGPYLPGPPPVHWWSRVSAWLWGLVILLVIAGVFATQVPRISSIFSVPRPKHGLVAVPRTNYSPVAPTVTPTLSGPAYTQAMVAGRDFIRADLRGALLAHLDLRGKSFQRAEAAGAVFAGSLLNGANLSHADLRGADLRNTCLRGANLTGAKLAGADFTGADIIGATVTPTEPSKAIGWASISIPSPCHGS